MNEKELKSHISFLVVLFFCIAVFLIGTRFSAKSSNKEKADFVGGTVATWEYIERDIQLDYFYHLDSKATYEQIRKEIGEPNGMRGSDTILPYYQVDDDLYVVISFSLNESGGYDKIETMLLCTENEDLDKYIQNKKGENYDSEENKGKDAESIRRNRNVRGAFLWKISEQVSVDLIVSEDQKIAETMEVLAEKGILDKNQQETVKYIRSLRTDKQTNVLLTYREAQIYSGDILILEKTDEQQEG